MEQRPENLSTGYKVIAIDEPDTLRDRLSVVEWIDLHKIKIMGRVGQRDIALLGALAHDSITHIDLSDADSVLLPDRCLEGAAALEAFYFPKNHKEIPDYMFMGCSALMLVELPQNLNVIGDFSFASCSSLTEMDFPKTLHSIGRNGFENCTALSRLRFETSVPPLCEADSFHLVPKECVCSVPKGALEAYTEGFQDAFVFETFK